MNVQISLRFLGIILRVVRLEVSIYCTMFSVHYKPVSNHFCSGGGGGVKYAGRGDCKKQWGKLLTFVSITSKNLASGFGPGGSGIIWPPGSGSGSESKYIILHYGSVPLYYCITVSKKFQKNLQSCIKHFVNGHKNVQAGSGSVNNQHPGSIIYDYVSMDPDPIKILMDPEHCFEQSILLHNSK